MTIIHLDFIKLFRLGSVSVPETGEVGAVYPLALAPVVEVGQDLGPDGLVQLCCVASDHGPLGQVKQQPPSLNK